MIEYRLPRQNTSPIDRPEKGKGLADASLKQNAEWFIKLRWIVAIAFVLTAGIGKLGSGGLMELGIMVPSWWLWLLAGVLVVANIPLYIHAKGSGHESTSKSIKANIWIQIVLDLVIVTALVFRIGTIRTFAAFTYLFHIVLACIFFPPRKSLVVTCIASLVYLSTVILQAASVLPVLSIFADPSNAAESEPALRIFLALFGVSIWFIVWYITSTLSKTVRIRDQQLSIANAELISAGEEKNTQMLVTTHDLKAPFAGIESNIQVLKYQYWDDVSPNVKEIIERIDNRAHMLRDRINAILVLGNLKSRSAVSPNHETVQLDKVIVSIAETLKEKAELKNVKMKVEVPAASAHGSVEQFSMLFSNLIANAISYSREGGEVRVSGQDEGTATRISIQDDGIGIRHDALPEIFNEYFRTKEASKFNRQSTGLGLAIVKIIAQKMHLELTVQTELNKGTLFIVTVPKDYRKTIGGEK